MSDKITNAPRKITDEQAGRVEQLRLAQELVEKARAEGLELVGPGGLLTGLTNTVLETALEGEISEHLGYDKSDPGQPQ